MKPTVPLAVISPTISLASVVRPWALSPAVTASSRMASRPPAPITVSPAVTAPVIPSAQYQAKRRATSAGPGRASTGGTWKSLPHQNNPAPSPATRSSPHTAITATPRVSHLIAWPRA
jgi:hypothetical protein